MNLCDYLKHNSIKLTTFSEFSRKMKSIWKNYILSVTRNSYEIVHILFILIILLCSISIGILWKQEWKRIVRTLSHPVSNKSWMLFFFSHTDIILTLNFCPKFNLYLVPGKDICFRMCNSRNRIECHFVSLSLDCHDLFARPAFIWNGFFSDFFCLLDQDASLCHLCCYCNSFDTPFLWHHLENETVKK